ncbi:MAG: RIP metalloprotease RseP [Deltaproteobacteria bacterium]|nr:RIP metalloprotease RseP [Deltaproteobacteria bacterium]
MTTFLAFVVVLGVLVFIHEFGHFLVAKKVGVAVEKFSLGFGPKIFGFERGGTEYCVSIIPLGGYVKLKGEEHEGEQVTGSPEEYSSRTLGERAGIVVAGPVMNLLLALLLSPLPFWFGMEVPSYLFQPARIGWVAPESPAAKAGIQFDDEIVGIDGKSVDTWKKAQTAWLSDSNLEVSLKVRRGEEILSFNLSVEEGMDGMRSFGGIRPPLAPMVGEVDPMLPAAKAGIVSGDRVVSVEGVPIIHWDQLTQAIRSNKDQPILMEVERKGERFQFTVTPQWNEEFQIPQVGILVDQEMFFHREAFFPAIRSGVERTVDLAGLTFVILGKLVTGNLSIKALGGPILIAQASGEAARQGIAQLLAFMAFLSLQLGVLNLLPIPALDGGHLLFVAIEAIRRRPLSLRARAIASQAGFFLLIGFILIISYQDLMRLAGIRDLFERLAGSFSK